MRRINDQRQWSKQEMHEFWSIRIMDVSFQFCLKIIIVVTYNNMNSYKPCFVAFTKRLKESLNFWNISINSISGGGLARIVSIPSPMSFFLDLRFLHNNAYKKTYYLEYVFNFFYTHIVFNLFSKITFSDVPIPETQRRRVVT